MTTLTSRPNEVRFVRIIPWKLYCFENEKVSMADNPNNLSGITKPLKMKVMTRQTEGCFNYWTASRHFFQRIVLTCERENDAILQCCIQQQGKVAHCEPFNRRNACC
jgi:hypothetical protein